MYSNDNYIGGVDGEWADNTDRWWTPELHKCADGTIKCINGTHPKYDCMMNDHLLNTIKWIEKKAENGIIIENSFMPPDLDMLSPPTSIYGDEVLRLYKYNRYIKEAKKRKIWKNN